MKYNGLSDLSFGRGRARRLRALVLRLRGPVLARWVARAERRVDARSDVGRKPSSRVTASATGLGAAAAAVLDCAMFL